MAGVFVGQQFAVQPAVFLAEVSPREIEPDPVMGEHEDLVVLERLARQNTQNGQTVLKFQPDQRVVQHEEAWIRGIGVVVIREKDASEEKAGAKRG